MKLEDYKAAIDEYQAVLTSNPDDEEAQELLKTAIEKAANGAKATTPQASKNEKPVEKTDHGLASITMAELYLKQNHLDKALEVYEEILKKDPNHAVARQKVSELKSSIAVNSLGVAPAPKAEIPKPVIKEDNKKASDARKKDAKFTDEDIFQVMSMDRGKSSEVEEKRSEPVPVKAAPKVESKETENSKTETKPAAAPSSVFSPAQVEVLKGTMAELASITGIKGCFLTSLEGISVVSVGENGNNEALEKQVLSIFKDTNQSAAKLNQGTLRQVLVTAETGHILLVSFAGGVLVVLADHQINLGMLRLAMEGAAKKVEKVK